jgi:acyl carrier protein
MTTPSEADIYGALTQIFRDVFVREDLPLTPELTGEDIEGWDSFKQVEIILATEEHFRIRMKAREIDALRNVGDFARLVALKVAEINRVGAAASIS